MSPQRQKLLHIGFAVVVSALAVTAAVGRPFVSQAVTWILLTVLTPAWVVTALVWSRREA